MPLSVKIVALRQIFAKKSQNRVENLMEILKTILSHGLKMPFFKDGKIAKWKSLREFSELIK